MCTTTRVLAVLGETMLFYILTAFILIATIVVVHLQTKKTNLAFISKQHGSGKTQFIMKLLKKDIKTFPTFQTTTYAFNKYNIIDVPANIMSHQSDQLYHFYKDGDVIHPKFKGFVVVDDISKADKCQFKNIISKQGLFKLLTKD